MSVPFICPVCRERLAREGNALVCPKRHSFDIARQGYVNLLLKKPDTVYEDKALFAARRATWQAGFFTPVTEALLALMPDDAVILDAGCGEGTLLHQLAGGASQGIGLDIAKPAVQLAAGAYKALSWCVADLANVPLPAESVDVIINMLTPANYGEFARVLRPGGLLCKLFPGESHLAEIREAAGKAAYAHEASDTLALFDRAFVRKGLQTIRYTQPMDSALAPQVYQMTPLTTHEAVPERLPAQATVDLWLVWGTKA